MKQILNYANGTSENFQFETIHPQHNKVQSLFLHSFERICSSRRIIGRVESNQPTENGFQTVLFIQQSRSVFRG